MKTIIFIFLLLIMGFCSYSFSIIGVKDNRIENLKFQDNLLQESMARGNKIYNEFCITCHLADGKGTEGAFPPIAQSDFLLNNRTASIKAVKYGQKGEIIVNEIKYNNLMTPLGLYDDEVADVMNFIFNSWGNTSDKLVTTEEVEKVKKEL